MALIADYDTATPARPPTRMSNLWEISKVADAKDVLLVLLGALGAVLNGLRLPAVVVVHTVIYNKYGLSMSHGNTSLAASASKLAIIYVYIALVAGISGYLQVACWAAAGDRLTRKLRLKYFRTLLEQDRRYHDCNTLSSQVMHDMSSSMLEVQEAIGEKMGSFIFNVSYFVGGLALGLGISWKIMLIVTPFILLALGPEVFHGKATSLRAKDRHLVASKASFIAEQALSSIRTVFSFTAEHKTLKQYSSVLDEILKVEKLEGVSKGIAKGSTAITWLVWAFIAWYGSKLIEKGQGTGVTVLATGAAFLFCARSLNNAAECVQAIATGEVALKRILKVLDQKASMDSRGASGSTLNKVQGTLSLKNVVFSYPSRPGVTVFDRFSLDIPAGKVTALVGRSGSGKSTIISLIERFYDPHSGDICLDGVTIRELNLNWYRHQIGLVSQEPSLFSVTIKDNILLGHQGASMDEVITAAKKANAHNFITSLPQGYETEVGVQGTKLSGGQKQRIAIARALIRKPAIMLLDEATSALDNESEAIVQATLDEVCKNLTTVVIAHRLNSIRNADYIAVLDTGRVVEFGLQSELIADKNSAYAKLSAGSLRSEEEKEGKEQLKCQELSSVHRLKDAYEADDESRLGDKCNQGKNRISFATLLKLNKPEWKQACSGVLCAVVVGTLFAINPAIKSYVVASFYTLDRAQMRRTILITSIIRIVTAVMYLASAVLEHYCFGLMGAYLTRRMRERMFGRMLDFEVGWFDREENSTGALCSRLATEPSLLRTLVGDRMYIIVENTVMVSLSVLMSFYLSWRLALVMVALQPFVVITMYVRLKAGKGYVRKAAATQNEVTHIANDGISQHKTVTAFCLQDKMVDMIQQAMDKTKKKNMRVFHIAGVAYGFSGFTLFLSFYIIVWYGGHLITKGSLSFRDFLVTFSILIHMGTSISETLVMTPDAAASMAVARPILELVNRSSKIKANEDKEKQLSLRGEVEYQDVSFSYPTRMEAVVLKSFNLVINPGETAALVGASGSGKSSVIALLQRFYDPLKGRILVDGMNIKQLNLRALREQIGLVSQQPALFAASIKENIAYGTPSASDSEVIEAATVANAHSFISGLPDGYDTYVGEGGAQLSGGQKQRIAIARAVMKKPSILLLDEATSALDGESEREVQRALDKIMVGRTTIVVAHRLCTVQNADSITVMQEGTVCERGTHAELISARGAYFSLVSSQL